MASRYEIEASDPHLFNCDCCDGLTVRLTRFVYRDGDAFAVYYATYSSNHSDNELAMLVSLGEWGEDSEPSQRDAFYCRVRPTGDSYEVMLGNAAESGWSEVELVGKKLSRAEALAHPSKATVFEIVDEAFLHDGQLRGFVQRVHCGDAGVPLEYRFEVPDEIFALGKLAATRAEAGRSFASLDGKRFFVRCLLPLPVEHYGTWSVGLWAEVSKADYEHLRAVWEDHAAYAKVRCWGTAANDLAKLELPLRLGARLELHVPEPDAPPQIAAPAVMSKPWPRAEFEQFAVPRGFL